MFLEHLSVYLHVSETCLYICDQVLFCSQLYNLLSTVCNACPLLVDYVLRSSLCFSEPVDIEVSNNDNIIL